jgi:hypothetical protein
MKSGATFQWTRGKPMKKETHKPMCKRERRWEYKGWGSQYRLTRTSRCPRPDSLKTEPALPSSFFSAQTGHFFFASTVHEVLFLVAPWSSSYFLPVSLHDRVIFDRMPILPTWPLHLSVHIVISFTFLVYSNIH